MAGKRDRAPRFVISVGGSSKKAGKSTLASYLVRELGAEYGLKVSSGGAHDGRGLVTDPTEMAMPGTDTGALVRAGAKKVLWVCAPPGELGAGLRRALAMFPPGGILVIEGNSAAAHLNPDFSAFVMNTPFESFKPSADLALERADLVLVGLGAGLPESARPALERELTARAPGADILFFRAGRQGFEKAMRETARRISERIRGCAGQGAGQ